MVAVSLLLGEYRLSDERHTAIVDNQLQVGPCTESLHGCILPHEDILVAVVLQRRIDLGDEVVAVVDDGIVVARRVVDIAVANLEERDVTEVRRRAAVDVHEVSTQLAQQDCPVGEVL